MSTIYNKNVIPIEFFSNRVNKPTSINSNGTTYINVYKTDNKDAYIYANQTYSKNVTCNLYNEDTLLSYTIYNNYAYTYTEKLTLYNNNNPLIAYSYYNKSNSDDVMSYIDFKHDLNYYPNIKDYVNDPSDVTCDGYDVSKLVINNDHISRLNIKKSNLINPGSNRYSITNIQDITYSYVDTVGEIKSNGKTDNYYSYIWGMTTYKDSISVSYGVNYKPWVTLNIDPSMYNEIQHNVHLAYAYNDVSHISLTEFSHIDNNYYAYINNYRQKHPIYSYYAYAYVYDNVNNIYTDKRFVNDNGELYSASNRNNNNYCHIYEPITGYVDEINDDDNNYNSAYYITKVTGMPINIFNSGLEIEVVGDFNSFEEVLNDIPLYNCTIEIDHGTQLLNFMVNGKRHKNDTNVKYRISEVTPGLDTGWEYGPDSSEFISDDNPKVILKYISDDIFNSEYNNELIITIVSELDQLLFTDPKIIEPDITNPDTNNKYKCTCELDTTNRRMVYSFGFNSNYTGDNTGISKIQINFVV